MSIEKFGGCKPEVKEKIEVRERLVALRSEVKEEEHSRDMRWLERRNRNGIVFARPPMDCAKTLKQRFRVRDLDMPERRKGIPVVERRKRRKIYRCALVAKQ